MKFKRLVVGLAAALLITGCGDDGNEEVEPIATAPLAAESDAADAVGSDAATLTVIATDIAFDAPEYAVASGSVEVALIQEGVLPHSLVIEDENADLLDFRLEVLADQLEDTGAIDLEPGTYVIYCDIPGHRAVGQEAVLIVD